MAGTTAIDTLVGQRLGRRSCVRWRRLAGVHDSSHRPIGDCHRIGVGHDSCADLPRVAAPRRLRVDRGRRGFRRPVVPPAGEADHVTVRVSGQHLPTSPLRDELEHRAVTPASGEAAELERTRLVASGAV